MEQAAKNAKAEQGTAKNLREQGLWCFVVRALPHYNAHTRLDTSGANSRLLVESNRSCVDFPSRGTTETNNTIEGTTKQQYWEISNQKLNTIYCNYT